MLRSIGPRATAATSITWDGGGIWRISETDGHESKEHGLAKIPAMHDAMACARLRTAAADVRERAEPNASSFSHYQIEGEPAMKSKEYVAAIVCLLCFAVHASAQDEAPAASANVPRVHIAAGYSFLRELDVHQSILGGWFISADKNINDHVGITYDLSASGTLTRHRAYLPGGVSHWGTGAVLLGPTFANRSNARFVWFSRVLAGFANSGNREDGYVAALAVAPGVGLDVNFTRHVGVRTTADYRSLFGLGTAAGERASEMWLRTGVVVSLGAWRCSS